MVCTRYLVEGFQSSAATAGLAIGIVVIGCLVWRFFTGSIIRDAGYRRVLATGVFFFFLMNVAYFFAHEMWQIFSVRFISGVAMGVIGTATGTYVATIVPRQFHGRGISYFSMSTALALCFGPFIGIALLGSLGYEGIFSIAASLSAVSLLLMWFVIDVKPPVDRVREKKGLSLDDFIDRRLVPFSIFVGIVCLTWGNVQALLADYAKTYDVVAAASSFFLLYAGASLLTRPITGKFYDAHGPVVLIFGTLILMIVGLLLLASTQAAGRFWPRAPSWGWASEISSRSLKSPASPLCLVNALPRLRAPSSSFLISVPVSPRTSPAFWLSPWAMREFSQSTLRWSRSQFRSTGLFGKSVLKSKTWAPKR